MCENQLMFVYRRVPCLQCTIWMQGFRLAYSYKQMPEGETAHLKFLLEECPISFTAQPPPLSPPSLTYGNEM